MSRKDKTVNHFAEATQLKKLRLQGEKEAALARGKKYLDRYPHAAPVIYQQALLLRKFSQPEWALRLLQSCPWNLRSTDIYNIQARILWKDLDRPKQAFDFLQGCPTHLRNSATYHICASILWGELGQAKQALNVIRFCPGKDAITYRIHATILWEGFQQPEKALEVLSQCPEAVVDAGIYCFRGEILCKGLHLPEQALGVLQSCPENLRNAWIYNMQAEILWKERQQPQEALDFLKACPQKVQFSKINLYTQAEILWGMGNQQEALNVLRRATADMEVEGPEDFRWSDMRRRIDIRDDTSAMRQAMWERALAENPHGPVTRPRQFQSAVFTKAHL